MTNPQRYSLRASSDPVKASRHNRVRRRRMTRVRDLAILDQLANETTPRCIKAFQCQRSLPFRG
jgi:hypothetical protein